jgi:hypothetical protein
MGTKVRISERNAKGNGVFLFISERKYLRLKVKGTKRVKSEEFLSVASLGESEQTRAATALPFLWLPLEFPA